MDKKFLIIGLIIIGIALMGGFLLRQNQLSKIFFCDSDAECVLTNTSSSRCAGCDLSSEVWKCVSVEESKKIKNERRKNYEKIDLLCYPCTVPRQEYICICENGICKKIEKQTEEIEKQAEQEIIVSTNKTEYEQGEIVKIIINNNLNENIYYYENVYCYLEYKKENKDWIVSRAVNMPCLKGEMKEIKSNEVVYFSIDFTEGGFAHYFGGGQYRIAFNYKIDKNITTSDIIYSNEFMIK